MASRSLGIRGRTLVALVLASFVLVALAIVWRRTIGISQSRQLTELESERVQLQGERAHLESEIREASTRGRLGAIAESKLGMHIPADNQVVILQRVPQNERP